MLRSCCICQRQSIQRIKVLGNRLYFCTWFCLFFFYVWRLLRSIYLLFDKNSVGKHSKKSIKNWLMTVCLPVLPSALLISCFLSLSCKHLPLVPSTCFSPSFNFTDRIITTTKFSNTRETILLLFWPPWSVTAHVHSQSPPHASLAETYTNILTF